MSPAVSAVPRRVRVPHDAPYDWEGAERHLGLIRVLAKRVAQRGSLRYLDHEDLVQVGLAAAARALPRFDASRSKVSTWLAAHASGAMRNLVKTTTHLRLPFHHWDAKDDAYRHATTTPVVVDPHHPIEVQGHAGCDPAVAAEERDELAKLYQALGALPVRLRRVLVARFFEGLTLAQVSAELGVCKQRVLQLQRKGIDACAKNLTRRRTAVCA